MYLTYDEFIAFGGDDAITQNDFARYEYEACRLIDSRTFGRVRHMSPVPEDVKRLTAALIKLNTAKEDSLSPGIASVSNDGYSESFKAVSPADIDGAADGLIQAYLCSAADSDGTPLLYCGVGR